MTIPEFVGRLPVATLEDLNKDALIEILTKPKNALVKQYQKLFGFENVKLQFTEDALNSVASKPWRKTQEQEVCEQFSRIFCWTLCLRYLVLKG